MVPPEASACTLWGGMSSCGLSITTIMILDTLVLRSAPHVLRLSRYVAAALVTRDDTNRAVANQCCLKFERNLSVLHLRLAGFSTTAS